MLDRLQDEIMELIRAPWHLRFRDVQTLCCVCRQTRQLPRTFWKRSFSIPWDYKPRTGCCNLQHGGICVQLKTAASPLFRWQYTVAGLSCTSASQKFMFGIRYNSTYFVVVSHRGDVYANGILQRQLKVQSSDLNPGDRLAFKVDLTGRGSLHMSVNGGRETRMESRGLLARKETICEMFAVAYLFWPAEDQGVSSEDLNCVVRLTVHPDDSLAMVGSPADMVKRDHLRMKLPGKTGY